MVLTRAKTTGRGHVLAGGLTFVKRRRNRTEGGAYMESQPHQGFKHGYGLRQTVGLEGNKVDRKTLLFKEGRITGRPTTARKSYTAKNKARLVSSKSSQKKGKKETLSRASASEGSCEQQHVLPANPGSQEAEAFTPATTAPFPPCYDLGSVMRSIERQNGPAVVVRRSARLSNGAPGSTPRRPPNVVGKGVAKPTALDL